MKELQEKSFQPWQSAMSFLNHIFLKINIHSFIHSLTIHSFSQLIHSFIQPTYFVYHHKTMSGVRPLRNKDDLVREGGSRLMENIYLWQHSGCFQISNLFFAKTHEVGRVTIPILYLKKLRVRLVKWLAQGLTARKGKNLNSF